ncbi:MAG: hypothetical protein QXY45_03375 [Candidatus Aenigmatarchaeota archaeon]
MGFKLIEKREVTFISLAFVWTLFWNLFFLPVFLDYLSEHPNTPIPIAFLIHQTGYIITWGLFSFALLRKPMHITRLAVGANLLFLAFEIAVPPLCISRRGNILFSDGNYSCLAGADTLVSWFLSFFIPYGSPIMFYSTYILGMMMFFFLAVLILREKELWSVLGRK